MRIATVILLLVAGCGGGAPPTSPSGNMVDPFAAFVGMWTGNVMNGSSIVCSDGSTSGGKTIAVAWSIVDADPSALIPTEVKWSTPCGEFVAQKSDYNVVAQVGALTCPPAQMNGSQITETYTKATLTATDAGQLDVAMDWSAAIATSGATFTCQTSLHGTLHHPVAGPPAQ